MRNFPREIEADLLFKGIDVHDWHQGKMSSRRLCILIEALGDDSAYQTERRDGDWSFKQYIEAATVNHLMMLRSDQAAIHASHKFNFKLIESPAERADQEKLDDKVTQLRQHIRAQMIKGMKSHTTE